MMPITTLSGREFNQDTSRAKKAASEGPVFISDRGKPAHVLLSIEEYRRITAMRPASKGQSFFIPPRGSLHLSENMSSFQPMNQERANQPQDGVGFTAFPRICPAPGNDASLGLHWDFGARGVKL